MTGAPERQKRKDKVDRQGAMLLAEVRRLRVNLPSVGAEILHHQLTHFRQQHSIKMGRDKFTKLLRENALLVKRKIRRVRTTWSNHAFRKYRCGEPSKFDKGEKNSGP